MKTGPGDNAAQRMRVSKGCNPLVERVVSSTHVVDHVAVKNGVPRRKKDREAVRVDKCAQEVMHMVVVMKSQGVHRVSMWVFPVRLRDGE